MKKALFVLFLILLASTAWSQVSLKVSEIDAYIDGEWHINPGNESPRMISGLSRFSQYGHTWTYGGNQGDIKGTWRVLTDKDLPNWVLQLTNKANGDVYTYEFVAESRDQMVLRHTVNGKWLYDTYRRLKY